MPVTVRAMVADDLSAVLDIERWTFPADAWAERTFRGELADQGRTRYYVVAVEERTGGTEIVGYAGLFAAGGEGAVQTVAVRADRRGHGIGTALLTTVVDEAARRGCGPIYLEVRADNPDAQRLYERFGFERVDVHRGYYAEAGADAVVMRRPGGT